MLLNQLKRLLLSFSVCFCINNVAAETWIVSEGGSIQSSIQMALSGDTIVVSPGIYEEHIDFLGKNITVTSEDPEDPTVVDNTVIDAGGTGSAVTFANGENQAALLCGFTITGGYGTADPDLSSNAVYGGGIFCMNASPTIRCNVICENHGPTDEDTVACLGAGIACIGSEAFITRNIIRNNTCYGAGAIMAQGDVIMTNNLIYDNSALYIGGVYMLYGGALVNNTFYHNSAEALGGHIGAFGDDSEGHCVIENNILCNAGEGGGVYVEGGSLDYAAFRYNNVWNNAGGNYSNLPSQTGLNGNISSDPLLWDAAAGDFRLFPGSLSIDTGNQYPASVFPSVDFAGHPRPIDGDYDGYAAIDMGAYEADGADGPVINLSTNTLLFSSSEGTNPDAKTFTVANGGVDILNWTIEEDCPWLTVSPTFGSSTGPADETTVTVSIDTSGKTPGLYKSTLNILCPEAINTPRTIHVSLYINNEGEITVPFSYPTIQEAIDNANEHDSILVMPGLYQEDLQFGGKNLVLTSMAPTDWDVVRSTIVEGTGNNSVVTFAGTEGVFCEIAGLTLRGGYTSTVGGGINGNLCTAVVRSCIISGNTGSVAGGGIWGVDGLIESCMIQNNQSGHGGGVARCQGTIRNCLVVENIATMHGDAINNCDGLILNCTIANTSNYYASELISNSDGLIENCIMDHPVRLMDNCGATLRYCCYPDAVGNENLSADPAFVDAPGGDYHLLAESPCINAGDPAYSAEPDETDIDGHGRILSGRVDIGADEFDGYVRPRVSAGPDQSFADIPAVVNLSGTVYVGPGMMLTYQWHQISGPETMLMNADTPTASFSPVQTGVYVFEFTADDGTAESHPDTVGIVVGDHTPVADAGLTVYATTGFAMLDGSSSYDRDGYGELTYQWQQLSGDTLTMSDSQSIRPLVSGFTQSSSVKKYEFELVVSDGVLSSRSDTVQLVVLPVLEEEILYQVNPPFNPDLPTIVAFGGGDCNTGGGLSLASGFYQGANVLTVRSYKPPYTFYGNLVIDYLYRRAPHYYQPIQTMGYSTGNMPAIDVAIYMNTQFADARYAVNRVTFFDTACRTYTNDIANYLASRVDDEPCWIENYYSDYGPYYAGTFNIQFPSPPATHSTPVNWYYNSVYFPSTWPIDVYHDGIVGGAYTSVAGPGRHLNVTDPSAYYFKMVGDYSSGDPGYLDFYDKSRFPGQLPKPVSLEGPQDGAVVNAEGALLRCSGSVHAEKYQLLFGASPDKMDVIVSESKLPPKDVITEFPYSPTYWTVRVIDSYGTTVHPDPIRLYPEFVHEPVENINLGKTYPGIQVAIDEAEEGEVIVVGPGTYWDKIHFNGKNITLISSEPTNRSVVERTIIRARGSGSVVTFDGTEDASCKLAGFTIMGGSTSGRGGGICGNQTQAGIYNCIIKNNNAANGGGLADCNGTVAQCIVRDNSAVYYGGGLIKCSGLVVDCLVYDNAAQYAGGMNNCSGQVINCTVSRNNATVSGGGLRSCQGMIRNCIIWANTVDDLYDCAQPQYSCYPDASGEGNIMDDPLFAAPEGGEYHLTTDSTCINVGDSSAVPPAEQTDLDGKPRLVGSTVDMGAYEYDDVHPCLAFSPQHIDFYVSDATLLQGQQSLSILNCGGSVLDWEISEAIPWLTVSPAAGQTEEQTDQVILTADGSALSQGTYEGILTLQSDNASNGFQVLHLVLHVDNNVLHVPSEYGSVQAAINIARAGQTVLVDAGRYRENIKLNGKNMTIRSLNPDDEDIVRSTILDGAEFGSVVTFGGTENETCVLAGFTLTGGHSTSQGGGINGNLCTAAVQNCILRDNKADSAGGGMWGVDGSISHCLFYGNQANYGGALARCNGSVTHSLMYDNQAFTSGEAINNCDGVFRNCTIVGDEVSAAGLVNYCDGEFENSIIYCAAGPALLNTTATLRYCCYPEASGLGNIVADPMFVDPIEGDYHLQSQGWRWDETGAQWVQDQATSRCIDAGNPGMDLGDEPLLANLVPASLQESNIRINMGVYGGTDQAGIAPLGWSLLGDLNNSGNVDFEDFLSISDRWLQDGDHLYADINRDGTVGLADVLLMAQDWLKTSSWY